MDPGSYVAGPLLRKVKCLMPVQWERNLLRGLYMAKQTTHFRTQICTLFPFLRTKCKTLSLPPLPKCVCFTLFQEGGLEGVAWPLFGERGSRRGPEVSSPKRPYLAKTLPLLQDSDTVGRLPSLPTISPPTKYRAGLPEKSQYWVRHGIPKRVRSDPQHSLDKHLLTLCLTQVVMVSQMDTVLTS